MEIEPKGPFQLAELHRYSPGLFSRLLVIPINRANFDAYTDLNEDEEVNLGDYSILARNFGQIGD